MKLTTLHAAILCATAGVSGAAGAVDADALQQRLLELEKETAALRAELDLIKQSKPSDTLAVTAPAAPSIKGNRVFFRGGAANLVEDRANGAFTDMMDVPGALGLGSVENGNDDGWYFGAGFDFLLSHDAFGVLPGTWALAELGLEFRDIGSEEVHLIGPVAECLLLNEVTTGGVPGALNCTGIRGEENLMMLTVSASPKLKFNEGGKLRPWLIPAGLDLNVISPPSDSTNYLDVGVQFAGGVDYEILPGITLGADIRYHLAADLTDPEYSAAAVAAAQRAGLSVDTDQDNDTWTAGISLGIGF